ncbi:MAG TPA: hypothetical protein VEF03_10575, partial [Candidatus Binataceae bacterium]|nr:hypothetical protein [Candidatus Binataceae bacterium]
FGSPVKFTVIVPKRVEVIVGKPKLVSKGRKVHNQYCHGEHGRQQDFSQRYARIQQAYFGSGTDSCGRECCINRAPARAAPAGVILSQIDRQIVASLECGLMHFEVFLSS